MKLYIKNMVCQRCIMAVERELDKLHIEVTDISLGEVTTKEELTRKQEDQLQEQLHALGFELIDDRKSRIIEKVKNNVIKMVHHRKEQKHKLSESLSEELHLDYPYLSKLFSDVEGITIEQYYIRQKIEKVKELMVYDELSLSQIADEVGYSSVAHLSNQFKKVTGLTPSHFKKIKNNKRIALDEVVKK